MVDIERCEMKVYLFDAKSGVYEGEDFCELQEVNECEGITAVAPPATAAGHVAVYDIRLRRWQAVTLAVAEVASRA